MKTSKFYLALLMFMSLTIIFTSCNKDDEDEPVVSQAEIKMAAINAILDSVAENTHVPGIVAGIWAPNEGIEVIYTGGLANLETQAELDPSMVFRIGSNTKTFTITVLLQLVDEGLISLDDTLSQYIEYPRADEVTIEMLTDMQSGIYNYTDNEDFWNDAIANLTKVWTFEELLAYTLDEEYYFDPGTDFHYSNTNTMLAAMIIESLTGKSMKENITERIIDELGLTNTTYLSSGVEIPGDNHSGGYYAGEYDPEFPECSELWDVSWAGPAGSMTSTIYELKTYVKALTDGDFISEDLQAKRLACKDIGSPSGMKYGIGLFEYKGFYGHNGGLPGFTSLMVRSPENECTIIIWYNCQLGESDPTQLLYIIPEIIYPNL